MNAAVSAESSRCVLSAIVSGLAIGTLGGLIGLGGAEFRLPLLIGLFGFVGLQAVIINKAISLIVVASALIFRSIAVPFDTVLAHWAIVVNLLAGSLVGAWLGADLATRLSARSLYRVIAALLGLIALALAFGLDRIDAAQPLLSGPALMIAGVVAGVAIGVVAALLGVAGGEFLIPTLMVLFGANIKLAGSLSLAISLPTMLVGFVRYSRDRSFQVLGANRGFVFAMAAGSMAGAYVGAHLLSIVPGAYLVPVLATILLLSAVKIWRHH